MMSFPCAASPTTDADGLGLCFFATGAAFGGRPRRLGWTDESAASGGGTLGVVAPDPRLGVAVDCSSSASPAFRFRPLLGGASEEGAGFVDSRRVLLLGGFPCHSFLGRPFLRLPSGPIGFLPLAFAALESVVTISFCAIFSVKVSSSACSL